MTNVKTTQKVTEQEKEEMRNIIAEEVIANDDSEDTQCREIVTCKNIEMGESRYMQFKGVFRLNGNFIPKEGRPLSFEELEAKMPNMFEAIENIEGAPKIAIDDEKEFTSGLTVQSNSEKALRRINAQVEIINKEQGQEVAELIKSQLLDTRKTLVEEIKTVETLGVEWNENLVWDIWMILRAIRQRNYMERESLPVDYLVELYSYIPRNEYKKIKAHYQRRFD